jgi:hypothetical protein
MLRQHPHLQECVGHEPDQGQLTARDLVLPALTPSRPTRNTSQSTGKPAEAVLSPSSLSMSVAELPTSCLSSAATLPPSSTPTGTVTHGMGKWRDRANYSQESLQRLAHLLGLRRWQGLHLEGAGGLHAAYRRRGARRCCSCREAERTHEVRPYHALPSETASNRLLGKLVMSSSTLPPRMSLPARLATTP